MDDDVNGTYDPHCSNGDISNGCEPVEVISVDRLVDRSRGPDETAKIATALLSDSRTGDHVIASQTWPCIWEELIEHKKGPKTIYDRPGYNEYNRTGYVDSDHNFSIEMLNEMIKELNRLVIKYSSDAWNIKPTASVLVEVLMEHVFYLQMEMNEVNSGTRKLKDKGFLGPKTRAARKRRRANETGSVTISTDEKRHTKDFRKRLDDIGQHEFTKKRRRARRAREERRRKALAQGVSSKLQLKASTQDLSPKNEPKVESAEKLSQG